MNVEIDIRKMLRRYVINAKLDRWSYVELSGANEFLIPNHIYSWILFLGGHNKREFQLVCEDWDFRGFSS